MKDWPNRREVVEGLCAMCGVGLLAPKTLLGYEDNDMPERYPDGWFYSLDEAEKIYKTEYTAPNGPFKNPFTVHDGIINAPYNDGMLEVPREFVAHIFSHLKEIIESEAANRVFRLDLFHGHMFIPQELNKATYSNLSQEKEMQTLLKEPELGVLYHSYEHIDPGKDEDIQKHYRRRNVIGSFNGRHIEILPLPTNPKIHAVSTPDNMQDIGPLIKFAAHKDGAFVLEINGETQRIDMSFDEPTYY